MGGVWREGGGGGEIERERVRKSLSQQEWPQRRIAEKNKTQTAPTITNMAPSRHPLLHTATTLALPQKSIKIDA